MKKFLLLTVFIVTLIRITVTLRTIPFTIQPYQQPYLSIGAINTEGYLVQDLQQFYINVDDANGEVQLESVQNKGHYLRHKLWRYYVEEYDGSTAFWPDTKHRFKQNEFYHGFISFESVLFPGYFLRYLRDNRLKMAAPDGSESFNKSASFKLTSAPSQPIGPADKLPEFQYCPPLDMVTTLPVVETTHEPTNQPRRNTTTTNNIPTLPTNIDESTTKQPDNEPTNEPTPIWHTVPNIGPTNQTRTTTTQTDNEPKTVTTTQPDNGQTVAARTNRPNIESTFAPTTEQPDNTPTKQPEDELTKPANTIRPDIDPTFHTRTTTQQTDNGLTNAATTKTPDINDSITKQALDIHSTDAPTPTLQDTETKPVEVTEPVQPIITGGGIVQPIITGGGIVNPIGLTK
ncbi:uncharacterized protein LOC144749856 [Ciona intestinalis]